MRQRGSEARIAQSFPWPRQYPGIVAGDLQGQGFVVGCRRRLKQGTSAEVSKQPLKRFFAPVLERGLDPLGVLRLGRKGIFQELFQVPLQFRHQIAVRAPFDGPCIRRRDCHRLRRLERLRPRDLKLVVAGRLLYDEVSGHISASRRRRRAIVMISQT